MAGVRQVLRALIDDASAKFAVVSDSEGAVFAVEGNEGCGSISQVAELAANNMAANDSLAKLIGEKEFAILFHEGERDNLLVSQLTSSRILTVIFDEKSSLGRVRLAVKKHAAELRRLLGPDDPDQGSGGGSGPDDPDQGAPAGVLLPIRR